MAFNYLGYDRRIVVLEQVLGIKLEDGLKWLFEPFIKVEQNI